MVPGWGRPSVPGVPAGLIVQVAAENALRQFDHSDHRGSMSHNRDPSGAASDYKRGFGPQTCRIELSRILLSVYPSTTTHPASFELLTSEQIHSRPPAAEAPCTLFLL